MGVTGLLPEWVGRAVARGYHLVAAAILLLLLGLALLRLYRTVASRRDGSPR